MPSFARSNLAARRNATSPRSILFVPRPTGIPFGVRLRVATMQATPATITAVAVALLGIVAFRVAKTLCRHAGAAFPALSRPVRRPGGSS